MRAGVRSHGSGAISASRRSLLLGAGAAAGAALAGAATAATGSAFDSAPPTVKRPKPQQAWDERKGFVPMQLVRLRPSDISPAAVFLASDALVTGAEYEVTGGDSAKSL